MDRRLHVLPRVRPLLATLLVAVLALGAAACGDDDDVGSGDSGTTTTPSGGGTSGDDYGSTSGGGDGGSSDKPSVVAQGLAFEGDLTVGPGEEFIFDNQSDATHTLTADDGEFDSGEISGSSQSDPMTAPDAAGDYAFHCEIHSSMTGTLTVEG